MYPLRVWPLYLLPPLSLHPLETTSLSAATGGSAVSNLPAIDHIFFHFLKSPHETHSYFTDN